MALFYNEHCKKKCLLRLLDFLLQVELFLFFYEGLLYYVVLKVLIYANHKDPNWSFQGSLHSLPWKRSAYATCPMSWRLAPSIVYCCNHRNKMDRKAISIQINVAEWSMMTYKVQYKPTSAWSPRVTALFGSFSVNDVARGLRRS